MTDYTCVKRLSKCKMFDVNNLSKDTSMYDIHYRKCSIHKGELLEKDEDIKYCDEAQTVLNENDIKLLLDVAACLIFTQASFVYEPVITYDVTTF